MLAVVPYNGDCCYTVYDTVIVALTISHHGNQCDTVLAASIDGDQLQYRMMEIDTILSLQRLQYRTMEIVMIYSTLTCSACTMKIVS